MGRLLLAGLYLPASGLTGVLTRLASHLSGSHAVSILGFAPESRYRDETATVGDLRLHLRRGPYRRFAADPGWLAEEMAHHPPSVAMVHGPAMLAAPLLRQLQPYRGACRIALYLPVEGRAAGPALPERLAMADLCLLYTETARAGVAALSDIAAADPAYRAPEFGVVGHGVDRNEFRPLGAIEDMERRRMARRTVFPDRPDLQDAFIVLNANRPYHRKRLDLTIAGFAAFAVGRSDAYLVLHAGTCSPQTDGELRAQIAASGAGDKILLCPLRSPLPVSQLNLLYNACDVGLTTAMGEGWGLTAFEHAATGAPQIVPDHTSFRENWSGAALLLPCSGEQFIFYESADMFTTSPEAVAEALAALYRQPRLRARLAQAALDRATEPRFDWKAVGARLSHFLDQQAALPGAGGRLTSPSSCGPLVR